MTDIRYIFTDMDESLLNDRHQISKEDLLTIQKLKANGIHFCLASGRHHQALRQYIDLVGKDDPVFAGNGSIIYDPEKEKVLLSRPIEKRTAIAFYEYLKDVDGEFFVFDENKVFLRQGNEGVPFWLAPIPDLPSSLWPVYSDFPDPFHPDDYNIIKVMIDNCGEKIHTIEKDLQEYLDGVHLFHSGFRYTEVVPKGASKGSGLQDGAGLFGWDLSKALAIGDDLNDLEMLSVVGYPVSPANANGEVKKRASYVCKSNNENPLTDAVRHYLPEIFA